MSGKSKDEQMAEKKQELEKRLQDVTGQLGSAKKSVKKGKWWRFKFYLLSDRIRRTEPFIPNPLLVWPIHKLMRLFSLRSDFLPLPAAICPQKKDPRWTRCRLVRFRRVVVPRIRHRPVPVIRVRAIRAIVKQVRHPKTTKIKQNNKKISNKYRKTKRSYVRARMWKRARNGRKLLLLWFRGWGVGSDWLVWRTLEGRAN